jgi:hypothetical protein
MTETSPHLPSAAPGKEDGAARIDRRLREMRAYEDMALRYYQAIRDGHPPPEIPDGIERFYASWMGEAIAEFRQAQRANCNASEEWRLFAPISRLHSAVDRYQRDRDKLGLSLDASPEAVTTAIYERGRLTPG